MVGSGYFPTKIMKRKELELDLDEVSDDLHDFSLSSPARKIRRLNAQLPPIMEEEKEQEVVAAEMLSSSEEMVSELQPPVNQERAIVLYKPVNSPVLLQSPSNVSVKLNSLNLVSGFKNGLLRASQHSQMKWAEEEEYSLNKNATTDKCLAVIPWVPSQSPFSYTRGIDVSQTEAPESMEAENEQVEMDIEDSSNTTNMEQGQVYEYGGMRDEGVHQWPQQQHCMIPTLAQNTSTPITWFK